MIKTDRAVARIGLTDTAECYYDFLQLKSNLKRLPGGSFPNPGTSVLNAALLKQFFEVVAHRGTLIAVKRNPNDDSPFHGSTLFACLCRASGGEISSSR